MKNYSSFSIITLAFITLTAFAFPNTNVNNNSTSKNEVYTEYCNLRFDYCLAYPGNEFTQQESSDNGDGAVFLDDSGKVTLTIVGSYNIMAWTPKDIFYFTFEDQMRDPNLFVENLGSEITDIGFETQYIVDDEYWFSRMYLLDDSYVMLQMKSKINDRNLVESYIPELKLELSI